MKTHGDYMLEQQMRIAARWQEYLEDALETLQEYQRMMSGEGKAV